MPIAYCLVPIPCLPIAHVLLAWKGPSQQECIRRPRGQQARCRASSQGGSREACTGLIHSTSATRKSLKTGTYMCKCICIYICLYIICKYIYTYIRWPLKEGATRLRGSFYSQAIEKLPFLVLLSAYQSVLGSYCHLISQLLVDSRAHKHQITSHFGCPLDPGS